jgi:hypothetical protein
LKQSRTQAANFIFLQMNTLVKPRCRFEAALSYSGTDEETNRPGHLLVSDPGTDGFSKEGAVERMLQRFSRA